MNNMSEEHYEEITDTIYNYILEDNSEVYNILERLYTTEDTSDEGTTLAEIEELAELDDTNVEDTLTTDNNKTININEMTLNLVSTDEEANEEFRQALEVLRTMVEPDEVDVAVYHLLGDYMQTLVREQKRTDVGYTGMVRMTETIHNMKAEWDESGMPVGVYLLCNLRRGIPYEQQEEGQQEQLREEEPTIAQSNNEQVNSEPVRQERVTRTPRKSTRNDYTLAWEIYSLGYSSGDVGHLFNTSAGAITRGIKNEGYETRTGAQTRKMRRVDPDEFDTELIDRINVLLEEKYDTIEERNQAFYKAFNKNMYELTLHEAEDEDEAIQEMSLQARRQGITIHDLARQEMQTGLYVERERSEFVNSVRNLHEAMSLYVSNVFGDVNVRMGNVEVESKVTYENGVVLSLKEAHKLDGKAMDADKVAFSVKVAEFIREGFEREMELLTGRMESEVASKFPNMGQDVKVTQLGNRLVVGLING